jgi:hypothetical protein
MTLFNRAALVWLAGRIGTGSVGLANDEVYIRDGLEWSYDHQLVMGWTGHPLRSRDAARDSDVRCLAHKLLVFVVEDSDHRFRFPVAVTGTTQLRGMVPTLEDTARWTQEVVAFVRLQTAVAF